MASKRPIDEALLRGKLNGCATLKRASANRLKRLADIFGIVKRSTIFTGLQPVVATACGAHSILDLTEIIECLFTALPTAESLVTASSRGSGSRQNWV